MSDAEQFSRSATPSVTQDNDSIANDNNENADKNRMTAINNGSNSFMSQLNSMRPNSLNGSNNEPQQQQQQQPQELIYKQENSNDKKDNEITISQSPQHANTAQKNFVVNLNQPPKIIQISNQVPMNLIGHQQQQQQQQKNSPILLYQMQHNQANKICNQQPQQLQQQQQQHMPQFKLIDDQRGKLENNSSSEHVIQTQNIMLNTSNQLEQNSGMLLENCEFINSTKANLARSTSQKYLSQNLNFEENIKPDQQSNEHKNDSNIRVYLSQQLQQKPMLINQQDTGKPNEFHIIQQHQQPQPQQQQQQYVDNNSNQQHQQAPIQLQLFAQPGQRFDNNFYNENNSQNSQTPAVSYMPIQIVSIDQPANHSSQNTNTNNNNIIINNNNNNNASSSVSKADEVLDHIDIIINEVAAGSGTIPYSSDFDDEESKINLLVIRVEYQILKFYLIIS